MGKAKLNIPLCAALVLLLLTMISIHLTSGLYARYTTTSTASDSARVAKFAVAGSISDGVTIACKDSNTGEYTLAVNNGSEVAIRYDVDLVFTEEVNTDNFTVSLDSKSGTLLDDKKTIRFEAVGELAPSTVTNTGHVLKFEVKNWTYVTAGADSDTATKTLNYTVNIHAEQID